MEEIKYPEKTTEQAALESTQIFLLKTIQSSMTVMSATAQGMVALHHEVNSAPHTDMLHMVPVQGNIPHDPIYFTRDTETGKVSLFIKGFRLYVVSGYVQRFMNKAWDELVALPDCAHCNKGRTAHGNK